jgi:hypothetical protein
MAKSKCSTVGDIGHEVSIVFICAGSVTHIFMIGGVLFFVIEFKFGTPDHYNLPNSSFYVRIP